LKNTTIVTETKKSQASSKPWLVRRPIISQFTIILLAPVTWLVEGLDHNFQKNCHILIYIFGNFVCNKNVYFYSSVTRKLTICLVSFSIILLNHRPYWSYHVFSNCSPPKMISQIHKFKTASVIDHKNDLSFTFHRHTNHPNFKPLSQKH